VKSKKSKRSVKHARSESNVWNTPSITLKSLGSGVACPSTNATPSDAPCHHNLDAQPSTSDRYTTERTPDTTPTYDARNSHVRTV
jgi:hypothetical protein